MHLTVRNILHIVSACFIFVIGYSIFINGYPRLFRGQQSREINVILKVATNHHEKVLSGHMFDAKDSYQEVHHKISSGTVHWFSPFIEKETAEKFLGPPYEHDYMANQVSLCFHDDKIFMVARVWLAKYKLWIGSEGRYLGYKAPPVRNNFNDNWLFYQHFDKSLVPISYSSLLGIPTPSQYKYGDGPTDPRLFMYNDQPFLLFNMDMTLNDTHDINYPVIWDFHLKGPIWINIEGGSPFWSDRTSSKFLKDRHWSPLIVGDVLYFVHNLDPLSILKCSLEINSCDCSFVDLPGSTFKFNDGTSHLRGGTPWVHFKGPYYISFAHSAMATASKDKTVYSMHLAVLSVKPVFRLIYVSQPFEVSPKIHEIANDIVKENHVDDGFVLPIALLREELGTYLLTVNVNDQASVLLRLDGIEGLMLNVMQQDLYKKPESGPIDNAVQDYVFLSMKTQTGEKILHKDI